MSLPDLLRLLSIPVFGWLAFRDYRTRRVPSSIWYPFAGIAILLTGWDVLSTPGGPTRQFLLLQILISIGFLVPLALGFHWFGGFGGADMKAFIIFALLFPAYPTYQIGSIIFPVYHSPLGVFALTIVINGMVMGIFYPVVLGLRNAVGRHFSPLMFIGRPTNWDEIEQTHGKLLESPDGFVFSGLDLDALRMYLRWRGSTLEEIRAHPDALRDPASLPSSPNPVSDGAVTTENTGGTIRFDGGQGTDPWGAEQFLDSLDHSAYGTTPEGLRAGLEVLTNRPVVWVSPGIPFLVPLFVGLLVSITYGDVLFRVLSLAGVL